MQLTSALTTDYLLTLPINIDWKMASQSSAIIYRCNWVISASFIYFTQENSSNLLFYVSTYILQIYAFSYVLYFFELSPPIILADFLPYRKLITGTEVI